MMTASFSGVPMRFVVVFYIALFPLVARGALDETDAQRLCTVLLASNAWVPMKNPEVSRFVDEFVRKTRLRVDDVLLCRSDERWATNPVWNEFIKREEGNVLAIGISDNLVALQGEHIRAWIAHEVAHQVVKSPGSACAAVFHRHSKKSEDSVRCEHDVDRRAMKWVGKSAMLAALRGLLNFSKMERRSKNGLSPEIFTELTKRILLLESVPE